MTIAVLLCLSLAAMGDMTHAGAVLVCCLTLAVFLAAAVVRLPAPVSDPATRDQSADILTYVIRSLPGPRAPDPVEFGILLA